MLQKRFRNITQMQLSIIAANTPNRSKDIFLSQNSTAELLAKFLEFDPSRFPSHWNGHDYTCALSENARISKAKDALVRCVKALDAVNDCATQYGVCDKCCAKAAKALAELRKVIE